MFKKSHHRGGRKSWRRNRKFPVFSTYKESEKTSFLQSLYVYMRGTVVTTRIYPKNELTTFLC